MNTKIGKKLHNFVMIHTVIWDGMYLDSELSDKKGWGHSALSKVFIADKINVKNFLISHHSPSNDKEIQNRKTISSKKVKFASENKIMELMENINLMKIRVFLK